MSMLQMVDGEVDGRSSSADLSSPLSEPEFPHSFPSPSPNQISTRLHAEHEAGQFANSTIHLQDYGGEKYSTHSLPLPPSPATIHLGRHTSNLQPQPPSYSAKDEKPKSKRPRKKPPVPDADKEKKQKPTRRFNASSATGGPARKKAKLDNAAVGIGHEAQSNFSDYAKSTPLSAALTTPTHSTPASGPTIPADYPIRTHDPHPFDASSTPHPQSLRPTSPAPVSRLSYDPVRSAMVERNPTPKVYSTAPPAIGTPSKSMPVGSNTSPAAIAHLIDPPTKFTVAAQPPRTRNSSDEPVNEATTTTTPPQDADTSTIEVDTTASKPTKQTKKTSSATPSNAPSPKPARGKELPPPLPQGSGLLSSSLFGNTQTEASARPDKAPNIIVHVTLKDKDNNIINFAQLAEEKYGFAALHPRLAAQKDRLARVAAAGAALEKSAKPGGISARESGDDDLSVDIDRDSDNEGDVAITSANGGGTGANSGSDRAGQKKRRKRKVEEYDKDDPFLDDTELAWEIQAAAAKDGYFVYCGPLVQEGDKQTERADGNVKRGRGRGRGGGPGSRGGRGGIAAATTATTTNGEGGGGGGGGRGANAAAGPGTATRGGNATRKLRVTKTGRANVEKERQDREKMAPLAAKPTGNTVTG